jgi:hypothetical protein
VCVCVCVCVGVGVGVGVGVAQPSTSDVGQGLRGCVVGVEACAVEQLKDLSNAR